MNSKAFAEIILLSSSVGLGGIIALKIPVLSALPEITVKENKEELSPKEKAFGYLRETGETVKTAAEAIGRSKSTGTLIAKKVRVLSLTAPSAVNSAVRTIKKFAKGQAVNGIEPNHSVILSAAKEITDRAEPKVTIHCEKNQLQLHSSIL